MNKKVKNIVGISVSAILLLSGCSAKKAEEMAKENQKIIEKDEQFRSATQNVHADYREEAYSLSQKQIDVGFFKKPLGDAMREVAQLLNVRFDESFVPSKEYKISIEFRGTLGDYLEQVRNQTGVSYKYRNNALQVVNKQLIKEQKPVKECKLGEKPTINISLSNVQPMEVFKYFSSQYGFNFSFKTKFFSVDGSDPMKQKLGSTSLFYTGCDPKEALYSFLNAIDFTSEELSSNRFELKDYAIENIDIPTYFNYSYTSGQTLGEDTSSGGGSVVSIEEQTKERFLEYIKSFMSQAGLIKLSNRGYLTVVDRPGKVYEVKRIIKTEIEKQAPMELSLAILRVTSNDSVETSSNFNASLTSVLGDLNGLPAYIGIGNPESDIVGGLNFQGTKAGLPQIFKALKEVGNTEVVRQYNVKTRNGILTTFRAVDRIPYVTTSAIASTSSTEVATEAKFATSGIIINMLPQLTENKETINISTDILVSEYLGDKTFSTNSGEIVLPQITENEIQVPVSIKMGESAILTGFNLKENTSNRSGLPFLIQRDLFNTERLFGDVNDANKASQLVIVVTPKVIKEF